MKRITAVLAALALAFALLPPVEACAAKGAKRGKLGYKSQKLGKAHAITPKGKHMVKGHYKKDGSWAPAHVSK